MTLVRRKLDSVPPKYVKYSESKPGDVLALGEFLGSTMVPSYNGDKEVPQHRFSTEDGTVALNSAGQLDHMLRNVEVGSIVEVVFLGKENLTIKGKKVTVNQFEVSILEESDEQ